MVKRRELGACASNQNLAHSRREVSNSGLVVAHPFGKELVGDVIAARNKKLCTEEEWSEDISLRQSAMG